MAETVLSGSPANGVAGLVAKWAQTLTIAALFGSGIWFLAALDASVKGNRVAIGDLKSEIKHDIRQLGAAIAENRDAIADNRVAIEGNRAAIEGNRVAIELNREAIERNRTAIEGNRAAIEGNRTAIEGNRTAIEGNRTAIERTKKALDELTDRFDDHHAASTGTGSGFHPATPSP